MNPESNKSRREGTAKVLVVDDHPVVRSGLAMTLGRLDGLEICGEAGSVAEALKSVVERSPDIVLSDLDLDPDGASGLDLVKELRLSHPGLPVLILSMHDEDVYAERVLRAGARGYLMKSESPERIAQGLLSALDGGIVLSSKAESRILGGLAGDAPGPSGSSLSRLSDRELEVFRLVGDGLTTRLISERLAISIKTVEAHLAHVKRKLGTTSGRELQRLAYEFASGPRPG